METRLEIIMEGRRSKPKSNNKKKTKDFNSSIQQLNFRKKNYIHKYRYFKEESSRK